MFPGLIQANSYKFSCLASEIGFEGCSFQHQNNEPKNKISKSGGD